MYPLERAEATFPENPPINVRYRSTQLEFLRAFPLKRAPPPQLIFSPSPPSAHFFFFFFPTAANPSTDAAAIFCPPSPHLSAKTYIKQSLQFMRLTMLGYAGLWRSLSTCHKPRDGAPCSLSPGVNYLVHWKGGPGSYYWNKVRTNWEPLPLPPSTPPACSLLLEGGTVLQDLNLLIIFYKHCFCFFIPLFHSSPADMIGSWRGLIAGGTTIIFK